MSDYAVGGRSSATAATANHAGAALWNPHSTIPLRVTEIAWSKTVATADNLAIMRITARGTAGSTVTPTIVNDFLRGVAPPSGALLDLAAYTVQPTLDGSLYLYRWNLPAAVGAGIFWTFRTPLRVPPGTGLALVTPPGTVLQPADVTFAWTE